MSEIIKLITNAIALMIAILFINWVFRYYRNKKEHAELNKKLDIDNVQASGEIALHFPWKDVKPHLNKVLLKESFKNHQSCPKCGQTSDKLLWINFRSPKDTWKNLCGRSGPLSICPTCNVQVEFILECVS